MDCLLAPQADKDMHGRCVPECSSRLYPDMSLRCIDFRITEETACDLESPLSVFGKSPVSLGKQFLAWD